MSEPITWVSESLKVAKEWLYQVNLDCYRTLLLREASGCIRSQNDKDLSGMYPWTLSATRDSCHGPLQLLVRHHDLGPSLAKYAVTFGLQSDHTFHASKAEMTNA